jgi:hypothetical protein
MITANTLNHRNVNFDAFDSKNSKAIKLESINSNAVRRKKNSCRDSRFDECYVVKNHQRELLYSKKIIDVFWWIEYE